MSGISKDNGKLLYEGSVKRVYQCPNESDSLLFEFSDDYSVFDWGKMPDTIKNKGRALTLMAACFFEKFSEPQFWQALAKNKLLSANFSAEVLEPVFSSQCMKKAMQKGLSTHYLGLADENGSKLEISQAAKTTERVFLKVRKALVQRPESFKVLGRNLFHYPLADSKADCRLIPLEVVFRFGMPQGSSLKERLEKDPHYASVLGLEHEPEPGKFFARPVFEFFSKLEPKDRLLSLQEALLVSGLTAEQFRSLCSSAELIAFALYALFFEKGIELWDGKVEFVLCSSEVMLADSIGPDELRLLYKGVHLSKEMIRQIYRQSSWLKKLKEAQELAGKRAVLDWKQICIDELKAEPPKLDAGAKEVLDRLYPLLSNELSGTDLFPELADYRLDEFAVAAGLLTESEKATVEKTGAGTGS